MKINKNYLNLQDSYLFSTIRKKAAEHIEKTGEQVIRMGIGDVTLPLVPAVTIAMERAVSEMGTPQGFKGYGDEQGYTFLRESIKGYYITKGVNIDMSEIFISDGAKSDVGNILDIFANDNTALIPNPVYPVYLDTNIMDGRSVEYMGGDIDNGFLPLPEHLQSGTRADIIYICSPNNPTGAAYTKPHLEAWVKYALENDAIILYDNAYESFIGNTSLPTSIFQIEGARGCAIEISSFSKIAGFTGTRCGYTVVPLDLEREGTKLHKLWLRRQTTKFNGVPYVVQCGAEAVFSKEGQTQTQANISYYLKNAKTISETMDKLGIWYTGGKNAPYVWLKCPKGMDSWAFFDKILAEANIVTTPGAGFGTNGEGFIRLSAFNSHENVIEAMDRFSRII